MTLGPRPHAAHRGVMTWPTAVAGTFGPAHSRFADGTFPMLPRSALANPLRIPRADRGNSSSAPSKMLTFGHRDALDGSLWAKYRAQTQRRGRHRSLFATYVQSSRFSASNL
jgi:hypothetical protein